MKHLDKVLITSVILLYLNLLFVFHRTIFTFKYNPSLIDTYYHSQDIPHDVAGRVFLSDGEIHMNAGYLYAIGADSTIYNFQHPPFIKYLYGYSILLTGNPYFVQILLGIGTLIMTYAFSKVLFKSTAMAFISTLLLCIDPLFISISSDLLLDLGQSFLILLYTGLFLYRPRRWMSLGIILGALAGSKFWGAPLFFVALLTLYKWYRKELNIKPYIYHVLVAAATFSFLYIRTFLKRPEFFNIIFFELKTLNYWIHHSIRSIPGASLVLFLSGFLKEWWGSRSWSRTEIWSIVWPISIVITTGHGIKMILSKQINEKTLFYSIPLLYLLYLGIQAPFHRYFIVILPFLYISFGYITTEYMKKFPYKK